MNDYYEVISSGQVHDHCHESQVRENLKKYLKLTDEQVNAIFRSHFITLKSNVDYVTANKWAALINKCGLMAHVERSAKLELETDSIRQEESTEEDSSERTMRNNQRSQSYEGLNEQEDEYAVFDDTDVRITNLDVISKSFNTTVRLRDVTSTFIEEQETPRRVILGWVLGVSFIFLLIQIIEIYSPAVLVHGPPGTVPFYSHTNIPVYKYYIVIGYLFIHFSFLRQKKHQLYVLLKNGEKRLIIERKYNRLAKNAESKMLQIQYMINQRISG